jgi:hypothetical protein
MTQTAEGSLEIEAVKLEDDGVTYTCRAYNGIGSDTRTYSIKVNGNLKSLMILFISIVDD